MSSLNIFSLSKKFPNLFLQYYFEKQVYTFFAKLRTKKIITIFTFLVQLKNALKHKLPITFFYSKRVFFYLLKIYKKEYVITDYFKLPYAFFPNSLKCSLEKSFLNKNICILFPQMSLFSHKNKTIILISKPSRRVFMSFIQLLKLNEQFPATVILLTTFGVLTHREALVKKCGGLLLCFIK